ncbi:MAG: hypothetical protein V4677_04060 [Bacteroidota bacterium]
MVEVFKTNIQDPDLANSVLQELALLLPSATINFDLNDCDHILRVQSPEDVTRHILTFFERSGHFCEVLDDQPLI